MPYWDERVLEMSKAFPTVTWDQFHIDILAALCEKVTAGPLASWKRNLR
jgi:isocitrate/isopropylmalate dehydrogenase